MEEEEAVARRCTFIVLGAVLAPIRLAVTSFGQDKTAMHILPETGFVRLRQIIGSPKSNPPVPAVIPVSKSTWWEGVRSGRYPRSHKLGPRTTAWRVEDIHDLIRQLQADQA